MWALIQTVASNNLISQLAYEALPQSPTLPPPETMMMVTGNNLEIPDGMDDSALHHQTRNAYHDFGVLKNLPIHMISGAEFLLRDERQIISMASARVAL